ncbi:MAG: CUAEP/CCAEP-tail radical SAM protein [Proteobacteria bacterium]|nr:CUAEP/CCAEP-tail radical SAM protein [Pseudomonadota bacterium]
MNVLLISTYDLGHQPFGLASPAAWLTEAGATVVCNDLAVESLNETAVKDAQMIAIHLPMHTATRLGSQIVPRLRALNDSFKLCFYGLYAPLNAEYLESLGADAAFGGEYEQLLVDYFRHHVVPASEENAPFQSELSTGKQAFVVPRRTGLPALKEYAFLEKTEGETVTVGYTEASRGCKHLCRHCPVVPVYQGRFRIVADDIVLADIAQQIDAGAKHITFGDPDFFNGITHARRVIDAFHTKFPEITYDVTIKVEHLLKHADSLADLRRTGCLFVTTAVESVDDRILDFLDKGHTRAEFVKAVELAREAGLTLSPTFVPFNPWTTAEGYLDLLRVIAELDLIDQVSPVQLAIRLLLPKGSLLLDLADIQSAVVDFDAESLTYPWRNPDERVDQLQLAVQSIVETGDRDAESRHVIFGRLWEAACQACGIAPLQPAVKAHGWTPRMSEPWYCCAEPTSDQFSRL